MQSSSFFFVESDLGFWFQAGQWEVKQYDTHPFYEALKSHGLKGVDFIGIHGWSEVVLLEVKNYRNRHHRQDLRPLLADPDRFVRHIERKYLDTLRAIRVIREYYQRKWWFRLFDRWLGTRSELGRWKPDWLFWRQAFRLAEGLAAYRLILWIEWDESYEQISHEELAAFNEQVSGELRRIFGTTVRFEIASCEQPLFEDSLRVEWHPEVLGGHRR